MALMHLLEICSIKDAPYSRSAPLLIIHIKYSICVPTFAGELAIVLAAALVTTHHALDVLVFVTGTLRRAVWLGAVGAGCAAGLKLMQAATTHYWHQRFVIRWHTTATWRHHRMAKHWRLPPWWRNHRHAAWEAQVEGDIRRATTTHRRHRAAGSARRHLVWVRRGGRTTEEAGAGAVARGCRT